MPDDEKMKKVSNEELMQEVGFKRDKFYYQQREFPRLIELAKKGMVAEKLLKPEVFDALLTKPKNRK